MEGRNSQNLAQAGEAAYLKLYKIDDEVLTEFIFEIENSFGVEFGDQDFADVNTYGELCDVIMAKFDAFEDIDDSTTQQAFQKLRTALGAALAISQSEINWDTKLKTLIPRHLRFGIVRNVNNTLGIKVLFLEPSRWYVTLVLLFSVLSVNAFFFSWKIAVCGIISTIVIWNVARWFGMDFANETVGDFAEEMAGQYYISSRQNEKTVNKAEIKKILHEQIADMFGVNSADLTRDSKFI